MHDIFAPEPDPLDGLLTPHPLPLETDALQQAIYSQTRQVLHRRRRVRWLAYAAALLVSFAAGLLAMRAVRRDVPTPIPEQSVRRQGESQPAENSLKPVDETALAREWRAFDSVEHRGELYQQAGDAYMTQEYDPQSALRCYTNALDSGTEKDLAISTDDSWLLMAIKNARQKENDHAKSGG